VAPPYKKVAALEVTYKCGHKTTITGRALTPKAFDRLEKQAREMINHACHPCSCLLEMEEELNEAAKAPSG
jgi:hypothetical protein